MSGESPAEFSVRNILDKLRVVGFSSANWRELGQRLTPGSDFDAIEKDCPLNCHRCLEKVIDEWKRNGDGPSWETLAEAVSKCREGGVNVANDLLTKVGSGDVMLYQRSKQPKLCEPADDIPVEQDKSVSLQLCEPADDIPVEQDKSVSLQLCMNMALATAPAPAASAHIHLTVAPPNLAPMTSTDPAQTTSALTHLNAAPIDPAHTDASPPNSASPPSTHIDSGPDLTGDDTRVGGSKYESDGRGANVEEEYKKLKKSFGDLVHRTRDGVIDKGLGVHKVVDAIVDAASAKGQGDKKYIISYADDLRESKSVHAVFDRVRQHWDYLHPEIYCCLIQEIPLCDLELVKNKYLTALDQFLNLTPVSEFCAIRNVMEEREGEPPQGFTKCITKHTWDPKKTSLKVIEEYRREFALCCNLQSCAVKVDGIRPSSTTVIFLVPESTVVPDIEFIKKHSIISIIFSGTVVKYNEDILNDDCFKNKVESALRTLALQHVHRVGPGAKSDTENLRGKPMTELTLAVEKGDQREVEKLLDNEANPNPLTDKTPLKVASGRGDIEMAKVLLDAGADPDLVTDNWTPLMEACRMGQTAMVKLLVETGGADPNTINGSGWTALMAASNRGHYDIVEFLLQREANPDMQDYNGWSALLASVYMKHEKIALKLIGAIVSISATREDQKPMLNDHYTSALRLAIFQSDLDSVVDALLENFRLNLNTRDSCGETVLMLACKMESLDFVVKLLSMGANPNINNQDCETPVLIAIAHSNDKILEQLLLYKANLNLGAELPLIVATYIGNKKTVCLLLEYGSVVYQRNRDGVAAYEVAEMKNFKELYSILNPEQVPIREHDYKKIKSSLKAVVNKLMRGPLCLKSQDTDVVMQEKFKQRVL